MVIISRRWRRANFTRSGTRAMRAVGRSRFRRSHRPGRARRCAPGRWRPRSGRPAPTRRRRAPAAGSMCPGRARSEALVAASMAARMVVARSAAEMPVVTPRLRLDRHAERGVEGRGVAAGRHLSGISSSSSRSAVIGMQISPRPWLRHEVDRRRRDLLGGDRQVALVLAVLVVDDDHHLAAGDGRDGFFDQRERAAGARRAVRRPGALHDRALGFGATGGCGLGHGRLGSAAARVRRPAISAARTTYLPSMSHSRFTRSPGFASPSVVWSQV